MIKIEEHYKKKRYINPVVGPYYFSKGELSVPVNPGPGVQIEFSNNREFSERELEKELTFMENEEVSDESVAETADRIRRLYVSEGYLNAQIAVGVERKEDLIKISFLIFEGEKVILKKIEFTGISIEPEALKRTLPFAENKPFNRNMLSDSRGLIVRFYNALGYLQADVVEIREELQDNGREMHLAYVIAEGPRTIITSIEILGNERIALSDILEALHLDKGGPFNVIDIGDARRRLLSLYRRYGFLDADIDVNQEIDKEKASLIFRIKENKPSVVGKVILSGNRKTKAKIVKRELILTEGERYNYEHLTQIKQRLYQLGIFSEVSIDVLEPGIVKGDEVVKDVLVSLKEGKSGSMEISLGYGDYEKVRGSLGVSYNNIGGYNRQIGFRAELSSVERRYIVNFREPWLFNWEYVPLKIFLIREEKRSLNIETKSVLYKIDKQSFIAGIEKEIADGLKIGLDYEYSFTDTKDVEEDVILSREDTGTLVISSVSPSLFYDTRDNPFNPSSGSLQRIVIKYASKALLSEAEFIKGSFQSSWYFQLMHPVIFAFSLRGGAAYGFGDNEEIPLIE
ncbi:MAG: BamA/TamA family outer membrane protein, partial [Deltaproteobacteria bacterium]|nr:BamA/TamA family outer membrane protein [Deltaproteobacteria bacterium]